jgi:putative membrane-bound dehydrogenase-like protein
LWSLIGITVVVGIATADENVGIRVPDGFEVSRFADNDLAHDIFSMTVDSLGRVVVSGPGYIRILIDSSGDGTADSFRQFVDGPRTGAQGMHFHGRDLLCTGDAGLIRYRDQNGDDRADGPPDVFLKIKTGGEHHAHAIRRGPDGCWYLLAGNMAGVTGSYATLPTSPIRVPTSGTLLRFQPDLAGGEIVADGFRNAYDFAFHPQGGLFVYDSDGERDVSLPWYRPTRILHALPGSSAGWVSRSWKRPAYFADMPPVVASFGRGSPTGVACYRHRQFPQELHGALFVLDWTFGRVIALPLQRNGSVWTSNPVTFMSGIGQFGFAPTDIAVGPQGSLFVSVGGRGTRGGVYRVTYRRVTKTSDTKQALKTSESTLNACLHAPQPLSSWSRARWEPFARQLGRKRFLAAALNNNRAPEARVRALEILTELYAGVDADSLSKLATANQATVRARAVWSAGRSGLIRRQPKLLLLFLNDADPLVVRSALQSLVGLRESVDIEPLLPSLARQLRAKDRFVRQAAALVASQLSKSAAEKIARLTSKGNRQAELSLALASVLRPTTVDFHAISVGLTILGGKHADELKLEAARLMQLALGDIGPGGKRPPVFDSYASPLDLKPHKRLLDPVRVRLAAIYPTGNAQVDLEVSRLLAMLEVDDAIVLDRVLSKIDGDSHPVDDIHQLIVASRIPVERSSQQRAIIAGALVALEAKITARKLNLDSNWDPRVGEMYKQLTRHDASLPKALLRQRNFGRPGHIVYLTEFAKDDLTEVVAVFVKNIRGDGNYPWNNNVVFVIGASDVPEHRRLVRRQYDSFAVRSAVLIVLAKKPTAADRDKFLDGLSSSQLEVLTACLAALSKLPASQQPAEQFTLLTTLRRLGANRREYELREDVARLLRRNMRRDYGFRFGKAGRRPQPKVVSKWTVMLSSRFPDVAARQLGAGAADLSQLRQMLAKVDWSAGNAARGRTLFEKRSCLQCHGGRSALGPDLAGIARRFSREDLFIAIELPDRDVSPRYQTTMIETTAGKVYTGLIIYESVDGLLLRNSTNQTFRIEAADIEFRQTRPKSLMPTGLLKDLNPDDLADLNEYLRRLTP